MGRGGLYMQHAARGEKRRHVSIRWWGSGGSSYGGMDAHDAPQNSCDIGRGALHLAAPFLALSLPLLLSLLSLLPLLLLLFSALAGLSALPLRETPRRGEQNA